MTRKAGSNSLQTKQHLLAIASIEFAEKGYQKASLRSICTKANVTTGALYCFFKNKDDIFHTIILNIEEKIMLLIDTHYLDSKDFLFKNNKENTMQDLATLENLLTLYRQEKQVFDVMLNNRNHPEVIALHNAIIDICIKQYTEILKTYRSNLSIDVFALRFFAEMQIEAIITCMQQNFSDDEIRYHGKFIIGMIENAFSSFIE